MMRAIHPISVALVLLLGLCGMAAAEVRLEWDFDTGSLDVRETRIEEGEIHLAGRDNYYREGRWKWFHFRIHGAEADEPLRFHISDSFSPRPERLAEKRPVYSYDGRRWEFFDQAKWDEEAGRFRFWNDKPFEHDLVHVAYGIPYPVERIERLVRWLVDQPYVHATPSGDERLRIGQSAGGIDDMGRHIPPHDLYGFRVSSSLQQAEEDRPAIVLIGGVHSNEMLGNYVLEGLVLFLVSEEPEAAELRELADVLVYPMVNPDGRYAGYNRGGVEHERRDTNRFWHETLYGDMREIRTVAEAIVQDVGDSPVPIFIDFHSFAHTQPHFLYADPLLEETPFWQRLIELEPEMGLRPGRVRSSEDEPRQVASRAWAEWVLKAEFGITAESMFRPGENIDRFRRMGRAFGLALHAQVVEVSPAVIAE